MNNRILRASRLMLGFLPFLGFCMVLLGLIPTGAVESIRNISWDSTPSILTEPSLSETRVSFEAQLSARDLSVPFGDGVAMGFIAPRLRTARCSSTR